MYLVIYQADNNIGQITPKFTYFMSDTITDLKELKQIHANLNFYQVKIE